MDTFALIAAERLRLADALDTLTPAEWEQPSLCGKWSIHEVAAHLNVPMKVGALTFVVGLLKARGSFDVANERAAVSLAEDLSPVACAAALRANADHRFTPPGFGPEAPLTDVIIHGVDILQPVGRSVDVAPEALAISLPFMLTRKAARGFGGVDTTGLRFVPDDLDLVVGDGDLEVHGPARSMVAAVAGRTPCIADLTGPGADALRSRA